MLSFSFPTIEYIALLVSTRIPPTRMKKFNCMYTKQKEKKRKVFHDGILHVDSRGYCQLFSNDQQNAIQKCLESKFLHPSETARLYQSHGDGDDMDLDFEVHLIQVDLSTSSNNNQKIPTSSNHSTTTTATTNVSSNSSISSGNISTHSNPVSSSTMIINPKILKPDLIKAFKAPQPISRTIPTPSALSQHQHQQHQQSTTATGTNCTLTTGNKRRLYEVDEDDLDSIWNEQESTDQHQDNNQNPTHNSPHNPSPNPAYTSIDKENKLNFENTWSMDLNYKAPVESKTYNSNTSTTSTTNHTTVFSDNKNMSKSGIVTTDQSYNIDTEVDPWAILLQSNNTPASASAATAIHDDTHSAAATITTSSASNHTNTVVVTDPVLITATASNVWDFI